MMGLSDNARRLGILFVAGDRMGGSRQDALNLPGEYKAIKEAINRGTRRDELALFDPLLAVTTRELVMGFAREAPGIAHFAGHGHDRALVLLDEKGFTTRFTEDNAAELFASLPQAPRLAVFSACRSLSIARRLLDHAEFAIGVEGDLDDNIAIQFSSALYELLAEGQPISSAYRLALLAAKIRQDTNAPKLLTRSGVDLTVEPGRGDLLAQVRAGWFGGVTPPVIPLLSSSPPTGAGLVGRFIALEGSADADGKDHDLLERCHAFVRAFVMEVLGMGGGMTLFVSGEPRIESTTPPLPCVFHWTVLEAVAEYIKSSPRADAEPKRPLVRCVLSPKTLVQRMPDDRRVLWGELLDSGCVVQVMLQDNAHNGGRIRTKLAEHSAALVTLGGGKGVMDSAEYFRELKKPCVPLNAAIGGFSKDAEGSPALYREAMTSPAMYVGSESEEFRATLQRISLSEPLANPVAVAKRLVTLLGHVVDWPLRA